MVLIDLIEKIENEMLQQPLAAVAAIIDKQHAKKEG
jgi:hypothetical protein